VNAEDEMNSARTLAAIVVASFLFRATNSLKSFHDPAFSALVAKPF
jgi:hypothetical protein